MPAVTRDLQGSSLGLALATSMATLPASSHPYPAIALRQLQLAVPTIAVLSLLLGMACSTGGGEDRPQSAVQITANHHLFGLSGRTAFASFPVTSGEVTALAGLFLMESNGTYQIREGGNTLLSDAYALEESGALSVFIRQNNAPTIRFRGGYGLEGDTGYLFFNDRVGRVGMFMGTRVVPGTADPMAMAGDWHLFTTSVLFSAASLPAFDEVGRSFAGSLSLLDDGSFTGSGFESTSSAASLPISGNLAPFAEGTFDFNVDFAGDNRGYDAGGDTSLIFGADQDQSDGASGLMAMMRKRSGIADLAEIAGTYTLGIFTIFLDPSASGLCSAVGTLEMTENGDFRVVAIDNRGMTFGYDGTFTTSDTDFGSLRLDVPSTSETWLGAVDENYQTLVIIDNFKEVRASNQVELSMLVALRPVPPPVLLSVGN